MASATVYDDVAEGADIPPGALFQGYKFWVAQRVFSRASCLAKIEANGGQVVKLEKQADFLIADHIYKDCAPGTISYEFIDKSIAEGAVLDPDDFPAGPRVGTARDVGSMVRPAKGTRAAYTPEEDRQLYKWVRDAQANGVAVSGNELYKQLEKKNPRHTWQSWRDRYLKKLQYMPPSAFNIPDNAPPSPPSDQSPRAADVPARRSGLVKNKDRASLDTPGESASMGAAASKERAANKPQPTSSTKDVSEQPVVRRTGLVRNKDKARMAAAREDYNVDQLAATFSTRDWEDLYAYVEEIDALDEDSAEYEAAWHSWAESKDNQTAEQWRQYYEKVVQPQWASDPASKREQIRMKVMERQQDETSSSPTQTQSWSQTQEAVIAASQTDLVEADRAPSKLTDPPQRTVPNALPSDSRLESEATVQQETPQYIRHGYETALKRIRGDRDATPASTNAARPTKIQRKIGPSSSPEESEADAVNGTQEQPLEISSAAGSQQEESAQHHVSQAIDLDDEAASEASEHVEPLAALPRPPVSHDEQQDASDLESVASSTDPTHLAPLSRPPQIPEASDDDDDNSLPSNTPTPRANKFAAFDTQAILSPSQNAPFISRLPRPIDSSPPHYPDSEASTTQSLQEFSSYLQDAGEDLATLTQAPLTSAPRPASPTPSATSEVSAASDASTGSGDPDPPLEAHEMEQFFAEQHDEGFSDEYITKALKRTRFRPGLATTVLEAWGRGAALPDRRGIWAVEEDELVESGDGAALATLQRKHTLDGWGGITERMNFLSAWSRR
ncbi:hypothetical protein E8E12_004010 [Didymella heteroderae]|uniref:DNA-binding protein RAP1 n=1 Tax=Didymella heteroderae TaxID=1769908 RepID=A0A9P5C2A5_9PLEO|nr:hypothetical protein E8E12_004010 [Didymella heteroderae]